jgi:hypothetical protein
MLHSSVLDQDIFCVARSSDLQQPVTKRPMRYLPRRDKWFFRRAEISSHQHGPHPYICSSPPGSPIRLCISSRQWLAITCEHDNILVRPLRHGISNKHTPACRTERNSHSRPGVIQFLHAGALLTDARQYRKAHRRVHCLEIGVQSVKNLGFISTPLLHFWLMLGAASVPLHLFFNGVVTKSASTNFTLIVASESFLNGGSHLFPGVAVDYAVSDYPSGEDAYSFVDEVALNASSWERVGLGTCLSIYDNPDRALIARPHAATTAHNEPPPQAALRQSQTRLGGSYEY